MLVNLIVLPKRELYKVEFLRGDLWAIGKIVNDYQAQELLKQIAFVNYHSRLKTVESILAKRDRVRGGAQEFQGTFWDRSPKRGRDVERFDDELFDLINTVPKEMGYEINIGKPVNSPFSPPQLPISFPAIPVYATKAWTSDLMIPCPDRLTEESDTDQSEVSNSVITQNSGSEGSDDLVPVDELLLDSD